MIIMSASDRGSRGSTFGGGSIAAGQRTVAQLNRIANALHLTGYREAAEMVALAALSVHLLSRRKARRKRRMRKSYQQAVAASDPRQLGAIVVPFLSRRRTAHRSS